MALKFVLDRLRPKSSFNVDVWEERQELLKEWKRYKTDLHAKDIQTIDRLVYSQKCAMDELRAESEYLYQAAIQIDGDLIPFTVTGPTCTPPIKCYDSPDGEYTDITKKW